MKSMFCLINFAAAAWIVAFGKAELIALAIMWLILFIVISVFEYSSAPTVIVDGEVTINQLEEKK